MGSERCFGLELETDDCDDYWVLNDSGAWGAKDDPTCNGKEFYSAILDGDEGLSAIAQFTAFANKNDWEISSNCGYHLHIDMRAENNDSLFAAAYAYRATQAMWRSFVGERRCNSVYCCQAEWTCADLDECRRTAGPFLWFIRHRIRSRHTWLNLKAYGEHSTFEVRLHHASLDEEEISNWVKAHIRFTDWATTLGYARIKEILAYGTLEYQFKVIACEAWQDEKLRDYYAKKVVKHTLLIKN
jgi:hypothetical protein